MFFCFFYSLPAAGAAKEETIVINHGEYGPYYHLRLKLTPQAIDFRRSDRAATSGGQFEIRVGPEYLPVPAPNCRGSLILRMPWTDPRTTGAGDKIAAKEALLGRILALEHAPGKTVEVVVELNPYVEVVSSTPLKLRLTQCNVFFRDAFGAYVNHTDALPRIDGPRKPSVP